MGRRWEPGRGSTAGFGEEDVAGFDEVVADGERRSVLVRRRRVSANDRAPTQRQ